MKVKKLTWIVIVAASIALVTLIVIRGCSNSEFERRGSLEENMRGDGKEVPLEVSDQGMSMAEVIASLQTLTSIPIEFYGRVIDENQQPLAGVNVVGKTVTKIGFGSEERQAYETATNENGKFMFARSKDVSEVERRQVLTLDTSRE